MSKKYTDPQLCRKLSNTKRLIDDLTCMNDDGEFSRVHKDIYHESLELLKVNDSKAISNKLRLTLRNRIPLPSSQSSKPKTQHQISSFINYDIRIPKLETQGELEEVHYLISPAVN